MLSATITNGLINIFTPLTTHENMSKISKVHKWPMCCGKSEQSLAPQRRRLSKSMTTNAACLQTWHDKKRPDLI